MPVKSVQLNILSNSRQAKSDLQDVSKEADKLGAKVVKIKAGVKDDTAGPFNVIERRVQRANGESVLIRVKADDKDADLKLLQTERRIKALDGKEAKVNIKVGGGDLASAGAGIAGFDKFLALASKDASGFSKAMAVINIATGVAEPAIAGVIVAVGALGSSLIAGGVGLGAYGLALKGPLTQLAAYNKAMNATAKTAADKKIIADTPASVKQLASALNGATGSVTKWGDSLAGVTLRPIESALKLVNPLLKDMTPFVRASASALDVLIGQLGKSVKSTGFANWLTSELPLVKPAIVNIGDAVGHVVVGIMGVFHAFNPQAASMTKGLDNITEKFAKWGTTLGSHSGFQALMEMFKADTPVVINMFKQLGTFLVRTAGDMAELSTYANSRSLFSLAGTVLQLVNALEKAHPELVNDALYVLAFMEATKKLRSGLLSLGDGVKTLHSVGTALVGLPNNLSLLKKGINDSDVAASEASGAWGTFGGKIGGVKTGLSNAKAGFSDANVAMADSSGVMGTLGGKLSAIGSGLVSFGAAIFKVSTYTKIWTGIQAAFDVVMDANPVVLVTLAIIALIGIIVLLAVKFKPVRDFFLAAWHDILVGAMAVWGWLKGNWPLLLPILFGPIGVAAAIIIKNFGTIKAWAIDVWHWIIGNWHVLGGILVAPIDDARAIISTAFHLINVSALAVYNWIRGNWHVIEQWLTDPIGQAVRAVAPILNTFKGYFSEALGWVKNLFTSMWGSVESGMRSAMGAIGGILNQLRNAFLSPIKFAVDDVWDPLAGLWNKAAGVFHLPTLGTLHLAGGGLISSGTTSTADDVPALLSRNETVVSAAHSRLLAPVFRSVGVPGYAAGGIPGATNPFGGGPGGDLTKIGAKTQKEATGPNVLTKVLGDLTSLAAWPLKKIADVVFGPINGLLGDIPSNGVGTMMTDMLKGLLGIFVNDIKNGATQQVAASGPGSGPAGQGVSAGEMANGRQLFAYLKQNVFGGKPIAAAGAIASIWGESTWNPFAQGTGGRGLIGWTPPGTISDSAFKGGMATQLPAIVRFIGTSGDWGVIHEMEGATSILQAANLWGKGVERYGINDVHSAGLSLAGQIMGQNPTTTAAAVQKQNQKEGIFNGYSYANGGWINEPVRGVGLMSGAQYNFAENGREYVNSNGGGGDHYHILVQGDTDPDGAAVRIIQAVRTYKKRHGNQQTGIG